MEALMGLLIVGFLALCMLFGSTMPMKESPRAKTVQTVEQTKSPEPDIRTLKDSEGNELKVIVIEDHSTK